MGGGMWAIRQNHKDGLEGVTLHNSLEEFSNKKVLGWDFEAGDTITILRLDKSLIFMKNRDEEFELPLDLEEE